MSKHTPGPWTANRYCILTQDHICIAEVNAPTGPGEGYANTLLMAAAPDLLRASEMALETINCSKTGDERLKAVATLREAIIKATGGAYGYPND